jgi:hypothetical protein
VGVFGDDRGPLELAADREASRLRKKELSPDFETVECNLRRRGRRSRRDRALLDRDFDLPHLGAFELPFDDRQVLSDRLPDVLESLRLVPALRPASR